jgi:DnaD and phage-associated domain
MACDEAVAQGAPSFKEVDRILSEYMRRGTITVKQIESDRLITQDAQMLLRTAGVRRAPTESDKTQLLKWLESMSFEVLMQAAEYARDAKRPMGYIARIVSDWQKKGVRSVSDARAEHDRFLLAPPPPISLDPAPPKLGLLHFQKETQYSSKELNALVDTIDHLDDETDDSSSDEPEKTP